MTDRIEFVIFSRQRTCDRVLLYTQQHYQYQYKNKFGVFVLGFFSCVYVRFVVGTRKKLENIFPICKVSSL